MVHHTYNPISIIAALLANSRHRLHSVLSHPHIRCNPQQPVPAGAPGWGSRMENSLLHWQSWETENSDFGKSEPCTSAEATPVSPLCPEGPRKGWMQHVLLLHSLPILHSFLSAFNAVTAGKLSVHNYKNAQHGGSDVFHWSSIWNSTSRWESNLPVVIVLMARGHSENLCLYSQRTAG